MVNHHNLYCPGPTTHPFISCITFQYRTGLLGGSHAVATAAERTGSVRRRFPRWGHGVRTAMLLRSKKLANVKRTSEWVYIVWNPSKFSHDHWLPFCCSNGLNEFTWIQSTTNIVVFYHWEKIWRQNTVSLLKICEHFFLTSLPFTEASTKESG